MNANRPPTGSADAITALSDIQAPIDPVTVPINVLANDAGDPDGDALVALVPTTPMSATVDCSVESGYCDLTAPAGFVGTVTFSYTLTDDRGATSAAIPVTVTLVANAPPQAFDDIENVPGPGTYFFNVRSNDSDPDGDFIEVVPVTKPTTAGGSVTCVAEGCDYTPPAGFTGTDSFTYDITDGHGGTDTATVRIGVGTIVVTVELASEPNPSSAGQAVTFTATVLAPGAAPPAGTITFLDGLTALAAVPTTANAATTSTSTLAVGSHPITARFDATGTTATSPVLVQVVQRPPRRRRRPCSPRPPTRPTSGRP